MSTPSAATGRPTGDLPPRRPFQGGCFDKPVLSQDQIDALTRGVIQDELVRMWTASRNTVFMVTHDVDEAVLLSDRIALMTGAPGARLAEVLEVKLARPRARAELIDDPEYLRLRTHIMRFLVERGREA